MEGVTCNVKVEPRSTFMFTCGLSYIASTSFKSKFYMRLHGKITLNFFL